MQWIAAKEKKRNKKIQKLLSFHLIGCLQSSIIETQGMDLSSTLRELKIC